MHLGQKFKFSLNWRAYLTNCPDNNVMDFLEFSWAINYSAGFLSAFTCQNHQLALAHSDDVNHYLQTELSYGAIAGSLQYNLLHEDLVILLLQTVPKCGSTKRCVVMDLSFTCSASVNDGISKTLSAHGLSVALGGIDPPAELYDC